MAGLEHPPNLDDKKMEYPQNTQLEPAFKMEATNFETSPELSVEGLVKAAKINTSEECPAPPVFLSIMDGVKEFPLLALDGISLFIGKAKSRKTFAVLLFIAMIVAKRVVAKNIKFTPVDGKNVAVVFDTEMAKWRVHRSAKRIQKLSGNYDETRLEVYSLRGLIPEQRIQVIEYVLKSRKDILLIAIDGLRDLIYDINDSEESTKVLTLLSKWCIDYNIHITTILHQNKGDLNARGHVGTESVNKSDVVISVSKSDDNPDISIIQPDQSRDQDFPPFAIGINDQGLPYVVEDFNQDSSPERKRISANPFDYPLTTHQMIVVKMFEGREKITAGEIKDLLKLELQSLGIPSGKTALENFAAYHLRQSLVVRVGESKSKISYYTKG